MPQLPPTLCLSDTHELSSVTVLRHALNILLPIVYTVTLVEPIW